MARPKKSDLVTADEVDWTLLEDPVVLKAISSRASLLSARWPLSSADDLTQEGCLALAARPQETHRHFTKGGPRFVADFAAEFMRQRARTEAAHHGRYPSLEGMTEGYEDDD